MECYRDLVKMSFIVLLLFVLSCSETTDVFYPSTKEAAESGEINRGWLPSIIPPSSSEIHLRYNLDNNRVWARMKIEIADIKGMLEHCSEVPRNEYRKIEFKKPNKRLNWWPKYLNEGFFSSIESGNKYSIYQYKKVIQYPNGYKKVRTFYFLIKKNSDVVFIWTPAS